MSSVSLPVAELYTPANWSQFFRKSILPTTFVPLSSQLTTLFLKDSPTLPSQWFDFTNSTFYTPPPPGSIKGALPTVVQGHEQSNILEFILTLKQLLLEHGSGCYPKVGHLSPSDCLWLMPDHTIRCITPNDVMLLLSSSNKVLEFVSNKTSKQTIDNLNDKFEPFAIYPSSTIEKLTTKIQNLNTSPTWKNTFFPSSCMIAQFRKFYSTIHPSESFRITIYKNNIMSIAQKDGLQYEWGYDKLDVVCGTIFKFVKNVFIPNWSKFITFVNNQSSINLNDINKYHIVDADIIKQHFDPTSINAVVDVYINSKNGVTRVLDINPLPDILLQYPTCNEHQVADGDETISAQTTIYKQILKDYQVDSILFPPRSLIELSQIHTLEPIAMKILSSITTNNNNDDKKVETQSNDQAQKTKDDIITYLSQTYINSIPLTVHIAQLLSNLIASKTYFSQTSPPHHPLGTTLHPLYSYLLPTSLPQIPVDSCLDVHFQYLFSPKMEIPTNLFTLWDLLQQSLPESIISHIDKNIDNRLLFKEPVPLHYLFGQDGTHTNSLQLDDVPKTTPYATDDHNNNDHQSIGPLLPTNDDVAKNENDQNTPNNDITEAIARNNDITAPLDYTNALPQCLDLSIMLLNTTPENKEILSFVLLLLQYFFSTQHSLDLSITQEFLLNETTQKLATIKTDIVNRYHTDGIMINQDGIVDYFVPWVPTPIQDNQHESKKKGEYEPSTNIMGRNTFMQSLFHPEHIVSGNEGENNIVLQSITQNQQHTTAPLSPGIPVLPLKSSTYTPAVAKITSTMVNEYCKNNPTTQKDQTKAENKNNIFVNVCIDFPTYFLLAPYHPTSVYEQKSTTSSTITIIDDNITQLEAQSKFPKLFNLFFETATFSSSYTLPTTVNNDNHSDTFNCRSLPVPFHYVTEFTQGCEEERITVAQEGTRLPHEDGLDGIDVSSAEGINAFVSMMMMMQNQSSDDDEDEDDDE